MKISTVAVLSAAFALSFAACSATDVVARVANTSFASVIEASAPRVAWSEPDYAWSLSSPEGDTLLLSADFSRNGSDSATADLARPDAELVFDAAPFLAAGLDIAKLPAAAGLAYELENGKFMIHFELGSDSFPPSAKESLAATFAKLVSLQRDRIGYHEKLDHYGIKLGNGNMFEWARDMAANDKDIVFALNPEPFIAAGVDPSKIAGWLFAKVETRDDAGRKIVVDKLLRPFNLR